MNPKVPFPKPPYLYKNYKDNLMEKINPMLSSKQLPEDKSLERFLPPKIPNTDNYCAFGERFSIKEIEFDNNNANKQDTILNLKSLNHSLIFNFLDLINELGKEGGGQTNQIIKKIEQNFLNLHNLINYYRPIQARKNLFSILNYQLNQILSGRRNFNECISNIKTTIIQLRTIIEDIELNNNVNIQLNPIEVQNTLNLIKSKTKTKTEITPSKKVQCTHLDEVYDPNLLQLIDNII